MRTVAMRGDGQVAEVTRKRTGEILQAVFAVLEEHPDGLQARRVIQEVERRLPPTPFEQSDYPSTPGFRRFDKIVRFNTIAPVKAGWLVKSKGQWILTEEGRLAAKRFQDPLELRREVSRLYQVWRRNQPEEASASLDSASSPASATSALEEAEETAWLEVEQYLQAMNPYEFQELVAALLRAMGYHLAWVSPPGPDQGLDILAYTDPLGAMGPRIKVQVKRRADKISVDGLRAFMALLGGQDVGIFISTGGFTSEAQREVRSQENRRISLIDLQRFFDLWVEHYSKVQEEGQQRLPLKAVQFLAPRE
jgi:restriction system protein